MLLSKPHRDRLSRELTFGMCRNNVDVISLKRSRWDRRGKERQDFSSYQPLISPVRHAQLQNPRFIARVFFANDVSVTGILFLNFLFRFLSEVNVKIIKITNQSSQILGTIYAATYVSFSQVLTGAFEREKCDITFRDKSYCFRVAFNGSYRGIARLRSDLGDC